MAVTKDIDIGVKDSSDDGGGKYGFEGNNKSFERDGLPHDERRKGEESRDERPKNSGKMLATRV